MECLEFRRQCGADPNSGDPAYQAHAESCPACAEYARELRALDGLILQALKIDVPRGADDQLSGSSTAHKPAWQQPRWLGLAASVLLAVSVAAGIWVTLPEDTLAGEVVEHILHEPKALSESTARVGSEDIYKVMARAGYALDQDVGLVTYTRTCVFRGYEVPHLVVQGRQGPITVMLLPDIPVVQPVAVDESGFSGTIIPFDKGSLAIVGESGETEIGQMTRSLVDGIGRSR